MPWLGELLQWMTLAKMAVAVCMVIGLSVLAEVLSPRVAGILSGYPLGAAITLFFIGIEINPEFAAQSAIYTLPGLVATQVFAYGYYLTSTLTADRSKSVGMLGGALGGLGAYFLATWGFRWITLDRWMAALFAAVSILLFDRLFRRVANVRIQKRVPFTGAVLLFRCLIAGGFVVAISSTAKWVGPRWAGLFAAFPITMLPFVLIIHHSYEVQHVHAILKNVPRGIGALLVYALAVSIFYPNRGIGWGTFIAYGFATAYLLALQAILSVRAARTARPHG
ncbi:MAG TPA: hypothetical protein DCZ69_13185 [Syntrophobacteraceae bacterium]|nr:hypothetical protein [Syntrophobacteraceae bacterium]